MTTNVEFLREVVSRPAYQQIITDLTAVRDTFANEPVQVHLNATINVLTRLRDAAPAAPIAFEPPVPDEE